MIRILSKNRSGPIGLDIGTRSVKLVQLSEDRTRLRDASCWDFPAEVDENGDSPRDQLLVDAIRSACEGRNFLGREAVVCLTNQSLFVQNLRSAPANTSRLDGQIKREIESPACRTSVSSNGNGARATFLAAQNSAIDRVLKSVELAGLLPLATDVEPAALARSYAIQFRSHADPFPRSLLVQIGYARTIVVIAEGGHMLFVRYVEIGGRDFDRSVACQLDTSTANASDLRRRGGDRHCDRQDSDVDRAVAEAMRKPLDTLLEELATCLSHYHASFIGQPLARTLLSGGEATRRIAKELEAHLGIETEISDPLRMFPSDIDMGCPGQWDVALGLALRSMN